MSKFLNTKQDMYLTNATFTNQSKNIHSNISSIYTNVNISPLLTINKKTNSKILSIKKL